MHGQDKTPTPVLYSEHLIAGSTIIDGFLVITNEDGSITPETGAYIYIYVNNILINEDNRTITSGEGRAGVVTVVQEPQSNTNSRSYPIGYWSFNCKALAYGSYVVVKAQAPNKVISDYSATHRVGGTPIPNNIVSLKSDGTFGPPVHGDTIIEGEFDGLKRVYYGLNDSVLITSRDNEYLYPYNSNLDLYPYLNGIKQKALPYNQIVSRNFIKDFLFFGNHFDVDVLVQGEPVNLRLGNFSQAIYEEIITGVTGSSFVIHPPLTSWDLIYVYCGGLRLAQNTVSIAYDYYISHSILGEVIVVLNDGFNVQPEDYFCIQYIGINDTNKDNYQTLVYQGSTDETYIIPYSDTYEVYKNGLRMLEGASYDFITSIDLDLQTVTITFNRVGENNIILVTDTILIDYKIADTVVPYYGIKNQEQIYITPEIEDKYNGVTTQRYFYLNIEKGSLPDPTYLTVYKDGVKQRLATETEGDFTIQEVTDGYYRLSFLTHGEDPFKYTFEVVEGNWVFTITDNFVVDFIYSSAAKEVSLNMLNKLQAMVDNKITASINTDPTTLESYLVLESPYTLEFPANSDKYQQFFGKYPYLYPGKDSQGHFKYFIDFKRNKWRYYFDLPLKRLMHITASTFPRNTQD